MLAGGNADRRYRTRNRGVSENIVRAGGLFNPERVESRQVLHCGDGLVHLPYLVCVEHQGALRPDLFAHDARAAQIVLLAQPDLQFEVSPAVTQRFAAVQAHPLLATPLPASPRSIRSEAPP